MSIATDRSEPTRTPGLVSVVIPTRGETHALAAQLDRLARQQYSGAWEIVVADNGSKDDVRGVTRSMERQFHRLVVVDAAQARGACHARNVGAAAARGDLLVFCDADDEVADGWLAALVAVAGSFDVVGGRLDRDLLNPGVERSWRPFEEPSDHLPVALGFQPYAPSGNCAVWRDVLAAVGGWNERYTACTDVELSWRALRAGKRLGFASDAVVSYRFRTTLGGLARQFFRFGTAEARLYKDFRRDGLRRSGREALRTWGWVAVTAPRAALSASHRGFWLRVSARRLGRVWGSARAFTFYP